MRLSACALLLLACRPDVRDPPGTPPAPSAPSARDTIDRDLDLMIAGDSSPDVHARVVAQAGAYARRLAARHAQAARSDLRYADLSVAGALSLLHPHAPDPVEMAAREFDASFALLLLQPGLDERRAHRLREQQARVHVLAGGLDRPLPAATESIAPDRVCVSTVPDGHGLTAERTCTCGDRLACKLTITADSLELILRRAATSILQCDDCSAAWTTCTLPRLTPGQQLRLVHAGRDLGTLTANASGWLVAGTCLPAPSP